MTSVDRRQLPRRVLLAVAAVASTGAAAAVPEHGEVAGMADTFVDSIGVNVHLGYGTMLREARRLIYPALQELGVRHIRDGVSLAAEGRAALRDACRETGVQATLICDPESAPVGDVRRIVASFYGPALVAALEGVNEPDGKPPAPGRPSPVLAATAYQTRFIPW